MNKAKSTEMFLEKQETDRWQIPIFKDSHQPPPIYEYYVDNLWFETSGINKAQINAPLKGSQKADIVIAGGGLAGLSSAFHLIQTFPDTKPFPINALCFSRGQSVVTAPAGEMAA